MGKTFESIDEALASWIQQQKMFFVATAPLSSTGMINCSPKGGDCLRIVGPTEVVYHDLTGSGVETIAHLRENGRIVIMFCAFAGPPKILRLHGRGTSITRSHSRFESLSELFSTSGATRSFIHVEIDRIADSCGFAVPHYEFQGQRETMENLSARKSEAEFRDYRLRKNLNSIEGLPGLTEEEV